jgi:hypothetical protein
MRNIRVRAKLGIIAGGVVFVAGGAIAGVAGTAGASPNKSAPPGPASTASAGSAKEFLRQVADITFPAPYANPASFDISYVDPSTQTYYLSDRTNEGIDAIDAANNSFGSVVGAGDFVGSNTGTNAATSAQTATCGSSGTGGPNGDLALSIGGINQLVGGNGVSAANPASNVKIFTLSSPTSGTLAATISTAVAANGTTGTCRADEMAYDPSDQLLVVANDLDSPPYLSFISIHSNPSLDTVVGQIKFPNATDGIEQSVYDTTTHLFYVNIPGVEVATINPRSMVVAKTYPTPGCTASGLALDEQTQNLLLSCSVNPNGVEFMSARTGRIVATVPEVSGADEVWYDSGTNHYYLGASNMTSTGSAVPTLTTAGSGTSWTIAETGATGGTFTLTAGILTTAAIADNASAATVQSALDAIVPGATVAGGPLPTTETVTFPAAETVFSANGAGLLPAGYVSPVIGVISGGSASSSKANNSSITWDENVAEPTTEGSHSVAADPVNGEVLFPLKGAGIAVFAWTKG